MTAGEIAAKVAARVDDGSSVSVSQAEALAAINEGQELAALMTLCLEKTSSLTLTPTTCWFDVRETIPDYIAPLFMTVGGSRIRPATFSELDCLDPDWQATAGTPTRYAASGFNVLAVTHQPAGGATAALTHAFSPAVMTSGNTPQIPEVCHTSLVDYGIYRVRLKEGAQGLERGLKHLNRFLDDMQDLGDRCRARSRAAEYDVEPFELRKFDRSRMIDEVLKWQTKSIRQR